MPDGGFTSSAACGSYAPGATAIVSSTSYSDALTRRRCDGIYVHPQFHARTDVDDQSIGATLDTARVDFVATITAGSAEEAEARLRSAAAEAIAAAGEDLAGWKTDG